MNGIALSPEAVLLNSRTSKMDRTSNNIYLVRHQVRFVKRWLTYVFFSFPFFNYNCRERRTRSTSVPLGLRDPGLDDLSLRPAASAELMVPSASPLSNRGPGTWSWHRVAEISSRERYRVVGQPVIGSKSLNSHTSA